jgi:organic radical activating enzyme
MDLDKAFCPSPWFHMRINNSGNYEYCRWAQRDNRSKPADIATESPITWFQHGLSGVRSDLLDGTPVQGCHDCHEMERFHKVSGRQKQLLKTGVRVEYFEKSMLSSPWLPVWKWSQQNQGQTNQTPQDWQIDLGNFCNNACVFCDPYASSKMATEYLQIGIIDKLPPKNWALIPEYFDKFINDLKSCDSIEYLHFIGGETLITPAFAKILQALIDSDLANKISIGLTTNLTVWDDAVLDQLTKFREVNLGMSIECVHPLNDYVRYGSKIDTVIHNLERWVKVADKFNWLTSLRITPTVFSIWYLDTVYELAHQHSLAVESCNFLHEPKHMRPSVLPQHYRDQVIAKLKSWLDKRNPNTTSHIVNTRDRTHVASQIWQDALSYVNYLEQQPDESHRLPELVEFTKLIESSRGNSVLDYLPEYAELLRTHGY